MMRTILLLDPIPPVTAARLAALLPEGFRLIHGPTREEDDLIALMPEADVVITGQLPVTARLIAAGAKLSLIHKWGVGVDNIDLAAARARAIPVLRTTGSNAVPVAELTIGLMIAALRHIPYADRELRAGRWRWGKLPGDPLTLTGKTVGLVGFGAIGRRVARLLSGFEARVLYTRRGAPASGDEPDVGATRVELPELLERSDVVSLHCPLTPETTRLIDAAAFARMKSTAVLVNVARGGVVDEAALVDALNRGLIHAAAMDVFETEPLPIESPLLGLDRLVVTPHIAASAADTFADTVRHMFGNIAAVARGAPPPERDRVA